MGDHGSEIQDLDNDPWVDYNDTRIQNPPLKDGSTLKFLIAGAGHLGLSVAGRLVEAGFSNKDIVVVDTAGGFGGTWYWNRYPGLMCDVEGYCYLPFLEETGYIPKHKYSYGSEILAQNERVAKYFGIQGQFCTKVNAMTWNEEAKTWVVTLIRQLGPEMAQETFQVKSEFVIIGGGVLNVPKVPKLPGWQELRATTHVFHTSRWDYKYTGGFQEQPDLVNLRDKTVAIIGTGATATQVVPELAKWAKHVYVIQRTPTYVGWRRQRETDAEAIEQMSQPGWQRERRINLNAYFTNAPEGYGPDIVADGWTDTPAVAGTIGSKRRVIEAHPDAIKEHLEEYFELDQRRTDLVRARIEDVVKDKDTAEKLKPWYSSWCKRPSFHDDYLTAFNQPNVTLVDTDGKGAQAFCKGGIIANGKTYEIDALILATGFRSQGDFNSVSGMLSAPIIGRNGRALEEKMASRNDPPLCGFASSEFPNAFAYGTPGGAASYNQTSVYDVLARQVAYVVKKAQESSRLGGRVVIEPTPEAEQKWGDEIEKGVAFFALLSTCTPGYYTGEGCALKRQDSPEEQRRRARNAVWPRGPVDWQETLEAYRAKGTIEGFKVDVVA